MCACEKRIFDSCKFSFCCFFLLIVLFHSSTFMFMYWSFSVCTCTKRTYTQVESIVVLCLNQNMWEWFMPTCTNANVGSCILMGVIQSTVVCLTCVLPFTQDEISTKAHTNSSFELTKKSTMVDNIEWPNIELERQGNANHYCWMHHCIQNLILFIAISIIWKNIHFQLCLPCADSQAPFWHIFFFACFLRIKSQKLNW